MFFIIIDLQKMKSAVLCRNGAKSAFFEENTKRHQISADY